MLKYGSPMRHSNRIRRILYALTLISILFCQPYGYVQAAAGDLDTTFGDGGKVITDFYELSYNVANAIAIQPDGKIVAGGIVWRGFDTYDFALARYNNDGSLDTSFGGDGKITTNWGGNEDVKAIAIQPDGKILAAGTADGGLDFDFAVARYNADGGLDTSFGAGGTVRTDFSGFTDIARAMVIQPDGKIVVAGEGTVIGNGKDFAVVRYNSNGSLDTSFGAGGKANVDFLDDDRAYSVALQQDGKIVLGGEGIAFSTARLNTNGRLDLSFGTNGKADTNFFNGPLSARGLAIQLDGKIVQSGWAFDTSTNKEFWALARYNTNGSLDNTFGSSGELTTDLGGRGGSAESLVIQPDGKIVAGGFLVNTEGLDDFALVRYNPDSTLDTSFGSGGIAIASLSDNFDLGLSVALQADGKIVLGGIVGGSFGLARFEGDGLSFDICLQSGSEILRLNSESGEYEFTTCDGLTISGTGTLRVKGCTITLQHNAPDRRVMAMVDTCRSRGTATVQTFSPRRTIHITDLDTTGSCGCSE